jgi:hypothetical protein
MPDPTVVRTYDVCRVLALGIVAHAFVKFEHPFVDSFPQLFTEMRHIVARSTPFGRTDAQQELTGSGSSVAE